MTFIDPNPPPPLVEEISAFKANCCLNLTLQRERFRRKYKEGLPKHNFKTVVPDTSTRHGTEAYAIMESQGYRPYMEDRHIDTAISGDAVGLYAVLDGHGVEGEGHLIAEYGEKHLPEILDRNIDYNCLAGCSIEDKGEYLAKQIDKSFTEFDTGVYASMRTVGVNNGATCCTVLVNKDFIAFANVGDSRGVVVSDGYGLEFVTLDHKPSTPSEHHRVHVAGGYVDDFRVNGDLAVSRTLGDHAYKPDLESRKRCPISNEPDITLIKRTKKHRCIILASDGVWDAMASSEVVAMLQKHDILSPVDSKTKFDSKISALFAEFISMICGKRLSSDNITMCIILLSGPDPVAQDAHVARV